MTTLWSAFNPFVQPTVSGVAGPLVAHNIRQSAIEFLRRTLVWRASLPAVPSVFAPIAFTTSLVASLGGILTAPFAGPTRTDYVLTFADSSQQVVTLTNGSSMVVWLNPVTAGPAATYTQLTYAFPLTTDAEVCKFLKFTVNGIKRRVVTPDMGEDMVFARFQQQSWDDVAWTTDRTNFMVSPPALTPMLYGCTVALQPTQTAVGVPDFVFSDFVEDIAAGALARLLSIPDKAWTDTSLAQAKRNFFEGRVSIAAAKASKGFSRGRRRVTAHFF